ncbi:MAG TPA: DNA polymerase/3'-5' exonuclease PolX [Candidatus Eisenbacteria bacterium]
MTNLDIARLFQRLATMLEIDGANPFRVRAYREAGRVVESQAEPMAALGQEPGRLEELPGIGKDLAQKIRDVVATGTTALYEEMKAKVPEEIVALTELQGLGPKRVKTLMEKLRVKNRQDLEAAARAGKLRELPGFGEVLEKNVLKALSVTREFTGRMLLADAWAVAHALAQHVRATPGVEAVEIAGSFRRRRETVGDLDLLACGGDPETVMRAFTSHAEVADVLGHGDTKSSVRLKSGLQVDLRLVPPESLGAALLYFTGNKEHNIQLRRIALEKGLSLSEYGLARGDRTVAGRTEQDVYRTLGMEWIPPELREAHGEIDLAIQGRLPDLVELSDLRADLHMHTDRTDGRESLEAMVRAARAKGYQYCAITEHSKSLPMTGGFDEERVRQSVEEIAAVRRNVPGIEVLHGLEVDILADGDLDLSDEGLKRLDWVVVSLHSRLNQPGLEITRRVVRALEHPRVSAMGHPTGRRIGTREPAALDLERVLDAAARNQVLMEINAQPDRLDLSDLNARMACERGVKLVISTDAHSIAQLDSLRYGVFVARRAGLTKQDIVNTLPYEQFRGILDRSARRIAAGKPAPDKEEAASPQPAVRRRAQKEPSRKRVKTKESRAKGSMAAEKSALRPKAQSRDHRRDNALRTRPRPTRASRAKQSRSGP